MLGQTQDLNELINKSEGFDADKADFTATARTFEFNSECKIVPPEALGLKTAPLTLTENALRQVCGKLGPAHFGRGSMKSLPFDFINSAAPDFRADILNRIKNGANGSRWMARGYKDTCRAVVSGDYPGGATVNGFENTVYLKAVRDLASQSEAGRSGDFHAFRSVVTPDDLSLRVSWRTVQDPTNSSQNWGLGAYIGNNETGNGGAKVYAAIKRGSCDNTFAIDTRDIPAVSIVHKGSYAGLRARIQEAIGVVLRCGAEALSAIWEAEAVSIPSIDDVLQGLAMENKWSQPTTLAVAFGMESQPTKMGIVNGLTWAAQSLDDEADRVAMELKAGELLFSGPKVFEALASRARRERAGL